jgi:type I restriction enzyme S subunit
METLQPKLRFPEFEGNWELKQFKEITSLITKGTTPQNFSDNGINFIKIECLNGHIIDTSKCLFIDEKTHTKELKRSILKEDDLLFAIAGATIGKCTIVTKDALPANTNQALAIIRLKEKENKGDNLFIEYLITEFNKESEKIFKGQFSTKNANCCNDMVHGQL